MYIASKLGSLGASLAILRAAFLRDQSRLSEKECRAVQSPVRVLRLGTGVMDGQVLSMSSTHPLLEPALVMLRNRPRQIVSPGGWSAAIGTAASTIAFHELQAVSGLAVPQGKLRMFEHSPQRNPRGLLGRATLLPMASPDARGKPLGRSIAWFKFRFTSLKLGLTPPARHSCSWGFLLGACASLQHMAKACRGRPRSTV